MNDVYKGSLRDVIRLRTLSWVLIGGAFGFITIAAGLLLFPRSYQFKGTAFEPPVPAFDFSLEQYSGEPFQMADQKDKVVLLFFGYTNCPDVCPVTLNDFMRVREILGKEADQVEMVMVTVDPARDTPEALEDYVNRFSSDIIGLSGSEKELIEVWKGYFVYRAIEKPEIDPTGEAGDHPDGHEGYLVDHTARVYVVDKLGNLRLSFPFALGAEAIAADVGQLLGE